MRPMDRLLGGEGAPTVRPLLKRIFLWGAVLTAVLALVSIPVLGLRWRVLTGFPIGYGYMCWCMEYLARTCERAVTLDRARAVRAMRICYGVRYGGLFLLCAALGLLGLAHPLAAALPQFFPKLIITVIQVLPDRRGPSHKKGN